MENNRPPPPNTESSKQYTISKNITLNLIPMAKSSNNAKRLNKLALKCEDMVLAGGLISSYSSPRPILYDISRLWRRLLDATDFKSDQLHQWSEKEVLSGQVLLATLSYLKRIGCKDIDLMLTEMTIQSGNASRQNPQRQTL